MVTKTITITEKAYNSVKRLKSKDESFSDLFLRMGRGKGILEKYAGILSGDVKEHRKKITSVRKKMSEDMKKHHNVFTRHIRNH
jgi:predicted CopG family antitoxin